jgi:hypothetical protein
MNKQATSVRSMGGNLADDEKQQGRLSQAVGRGHPHDLQWPAEELTDDDDT